MKKFCSHSSPSADSRRAVVSYKPKYVHKVLVNGLVKLAQENKCETMRPTVYMFINV